MYIKINFKIKLWPNERLYSSSDDSAFWFFQVFRIADVCTYKDHFKSKASYFIHTKKSLINQISKNIFTKHILGSKAIPRLLVKKLIKSVLSKYIRRLLLCLWANCIADFLSFISCFVMKKPFLIFNEVEVLD